MISVVIPTYLQPGFGGDKLIVLLNSIMRQRVSVPYEIVVSDNDETGEIERICNCFDFLKIRHVFNPVKGASENFNSAIDNARYQNVKIMCMDDAFRTVDAIDRFDHMLSVRSWVISNYVKMDKNGSTTGSVISKYDHKQMERNITGMPSVVGFKRCDVRFDPRLKTFCDTYFYYQLFEKYGTPGHIVEYAIACRYWTGSLSSNQPSYKKEDLALMRKHKMIKC